MPPTVSKVRRRRSLGAPSPSVTAPALLAGLVESSNDAIYSRDLEGRVTSWNRAAERIFGYRAEELLGRSTAPLVPADRKDELYQLMGQVRRGERIDHLETVRLHKDGHPLHVSLSVSPIRGARGRVIGSSTIVRDITVERKLEAEVLDSAERERSRLGRDLHDGLCQQLGGMELLGRSLARALRQRSLPESRQAGLLVRQIRATIGQVRSLARGLTPMFSDPGGLMFALEEMASTTRTLTAIRCRLICEEPVLVNNLSSAVHLFRIAQEAVGNATRHARPRRIEIRLSKEDGHVRLEIWNDGRPLPSPGSHSIGLGRRIMAYRARLLGGTVALEPAVPVGTRLVCRVPLPLPES